MKDQVTERALKIAKDRYGLNQRQFAERLGADKQHITNWLARGMPSSRHMPVAKLLKISVEELLTGEHAESVGDLVAAARIAEPSAPYFGVQLTEEAALFAAEWTKLRSPLKAQVQALIETLVGEQKREERRKSKPDERPRP